MIFHFRPLHQAASISNWQLTECEMLFTAIEDDASRTAVREARKIAPKGNGPRDYAQALQRYVHPQKNRDEIQLIIARPITSGGVGLSAFQDGIRLNSAFRYLRISCGFKRIEKERRDYWLYLLLRAGIRSSTLALYQAMIPQIIKTHC